ncbi:helix-turn-helix transcriptional regulator [Jidongwangia harbinensis]|uniref:helix-turn-helix transcriptional regulator n=1 Tax=Jidongwangia harbinensis TaxID=2878561 RepID=UPI001CDA0596|nr:AraC family transcriptional regulator [Jidongwangia harbinensis]MCA2219097.1 AraC family transcriptional regulator [Jidongwangia harbinensis]
MGRFEELRDLSQRLFYPHRWQAASSVQRLPVELTAMTLGAVTISTATIRGEVTASSTERSGYFIALTANGSIDVEHRGVRTRVSRDTAAVYRPSGPGRMHWNGKGAQPFGVKVESAVLEATLRSHLQRPTAKQVNLAAGMDTAVGPGRSWARLVVFLHREAVSGTTLLDNPLIAVRLHDAVVLGLLCAVDHPDRQQLLTPGGAWRPRSVKLAIDIMQAHPEEALSVTTLAGTVGVSARSLQAGFRQYVGMTPMAYLRQVRLTRARDDLLHGDPHGESVAAVAHRWGFGHVGRFAAVYRQAFGESPSQTLRR